MAVFLLELFETVCTGCIFYLFPLVEILVMLFATLINFLCDSGCQLFCNNCYCGAKLPFLYLFSYFCVLLKEFQLLLQIHGTGSQQHVS